MDIWIIRDGEKTGPFHDFEIRRKIEAGELSATTSAWHEGLTAWKPLVEIDLFTREFQLEKSAAAKAEEISSSLPESPPLPLEAKPKTYYMRRFWARWLDLALFSSLWWLGMWAAHQDIGSILVSPLHGFTQFIPWFIPAPPLRHHSREMVARPARRQCWR
jgi:GYF domain 2